MNLNDETVEALQCRLYQAKAGIFELETICKILKSYIKENYTELMPVFDCIDTKLDKINKIFEQKS